LHNIAQKLHSIAQIIVEQYFIILHNIDQIIGQSTHLDPLPRPSRPGIQDHLLQVSPNLKRTHHPVLNQMELALDSLVTWIDRQQEGPAPPCLGLAAQRRGAGRRPKNSPNIDLILEHRKNPENLNHGTWSLAACAAVLAVILAVAICFQTKKMFQILVPRCILLNFQVQERHLQPWQIICKVGSSCTFLHAKD
jgi:hypothetical protein